MLRKLLASQDEPKPQPTSIFSTAGASASPPQGAGPGDGDLPPVPSGLAELQQFINEVDGEWATIMAKLVEQDMGATMDAFAELQSRLHRLAARKKVAEVKLKTLAAGAAPKGPYMAPDDEASDGGYPDDGDTGYGPKGTTRCITDTPAASPDLDLVGSPFGSLPA